MKIKELLARYNLKTRQSIYNWCKALDITLEKSNGHAYANKEQIQLLDQLSKHIKEGGKLTTFTPVSNVEIDIPIDTKIDIPIDDKIDSKLTQKIELVYHSIDTPLSGEMIQAIVEGAVTLTASKLRPVNPLWYMDVLENALSSNWLLTTAEIQELIGVKPKTKKGEKIYKRGNWLFIKSGKIGNQTAWKVMREEK